MKYYTLDAEEQEILQRFETGEFVPSKKISKEMLIVAARETLNRNKPIKY